MDRESVNIHIRVFEKGLPSYERSDSDAAKQRAAFRVSADAFRTACASSERAEADVYAIRGVMQQQAVRIAELEAETARLGRALAIAEEKLEPGGDDNG